MVVLLETIQNQKCFQYEQDVYKFKTGIAMVSPVCSIIAEIFLKNLEQQLMKHTVESNNCNTYCVRCVNDNFIMYSKKQNYTSNNIRQF
jgi:hypothetical protein